MSAEEGTRSIGLDDLAKLPPEQLLQLKQQLDGEVSVLNESLASLKAFASRVESASAALKQLSSQSEGKQLLVPLTGSLYIPGALSKVDTVLVDIGTGYFVEKDLQAGVAYFGRKLEYLKTNHQKVLELAAEKGQVADLVASALQSRAQAAPAGGAGGAV